MASLAGLQSRAGSGWKREREREREECDSKLQSVEWRLRCELIGRVVEWVCVCVCV